MFTMYLCIANRCDSRDAISTARKLVSQEKVGEALRVLLNETITCVPPGKQFSAVRLALARTSRSYVQYALQIAREQEVEQAVLIDCLVRLDDLYAEIEAIALEFGDVPVHPDDDYGRWMRYWGDITALRHRAHRELRRICP